MRHWATPFQYSRSPVQHAAQLVHVPGYKTETPAKLQEPTVSAPVSAQPAGGKAESKAAKPSGAGATTAGTESAGAPKAKAEGGYGHAVQGLIHQMGEKMHLVKQEKK
jgi:hypothetical protein